MDAGSYFLLRFLTFEFSFQTVPLQFLNALLSYLGDSISYGTKSSGLLSISKLFQSGDSFGRNHLRCECFAYETLQDSWIAKLFEIIVGYPESMYPAGVFLEAVGEPIRDYLRGRKDTVKCMVTVLTEGSGGNANGSGNSGDSLLEELMCDEESQENVGFDEDFHLAWLSASRYSFCLFIFLVYHLA